MTDKQKTIMMSYFMFTSLSTVGLGDYHPVTDEERLACICILLIGIVIASFIITKMMVVSARVGEDSSETEGRLDYFMRTLAKLNYDSPDCDTLYSSIK